jgi:hypothetical protein
VAVFPTVSSASYESPCPAQIIKLETLAQDVEAVCRSERDAAIVC